ncbi:hypothetical protein COOONC_26571, partial [Cooperia oncophora]
YAPTFPPGYESEEQRYPEPAPFNVRPGYSKEDKPCALNGTNAQYNSGDREPVFKITQAIAVADFDLPERGLIVFGLEDGNGEEQDNESASQLVLQERTPKTCFTTSMPFFPSI